MPKATKISHADLNHVQSLAITLLEQRGLMLKDIAAFAGVDPSMLSHVRGIRQVLLSPVPQARLARLASQWGIDALGNFHAAPGKMLVAVPAAREVNHSFRDEEREIRNFYLGIEQTERGHLALGAQHLQAAHRAVLRAVHENLLWT